MTPQAALLFDLDGTLVDTDHLHHAAFVAILAERGRELPLAEYRAHIMGQPNADILGRYFPGEDAAILDRKEAMFRDALAASVEPLPGIHALLDWAEANGVAAAVVTNAPRAERARHARRRRPRPPPPRPSSSARNASAPKPDPAPYQAAMAAARRHPLARPSPSRTAAPACAPPAPPARMSSA